MRHLLLIICTFFSFAAVGQIYNPVKWNFDLKSAGNGEYILTAKATIDKGWWVYSQHLESEDGPVATMVYFDEGPHFKLVGKNKESNNVHKIFDKIFEMNVSKFQDYYTIEQKIKVIDPSKPITGAINFMTCNDERCLPPTDAEFSLKVPPGGSGDAKSKAEATSDTKSLTQADKKIPAEEKSPSTEKKKLTEDAYTTASSSSTPSASKTNNTIAVTGVSSTGIFNPVKWNIRSEKKSDDIYEVIAHANIDDGWHIYGVGEFVMDGPIPTSLEIADNAAYTKEGKPTAQSSKQIQVHDNFFDMDVVEYLHDVTLTQIIKSSSATIVSGAIDFVACDDSKCLPPGYFEFKIDLSTGKQVTEEKQAEGPRVSGSYVDHAIPSIQATYEKPLSDCGTAPVEKSSNLWWMFIFGMINGFIALLTPCVFPMIPLTVSFFTKDTKRKGWENGMWYGISIIAIYVVLGLLITILFGAAALNDLSTNPIANTIFFVIFIFFAFSFFGYYEITLPSSWSNKSDQMADKGGFIGIFFMAATLAIVSFSCTGPLIGSALVSAASTGFLGPLIVMGGFSLALAIPFGLFAAFPAWLNSLPKSGGWMNSVKVILGFAELALAFKFLSVADMTAHWGFLRYELFLAIWVLCAIGMAAYMFGWIRFPHDNPKRKLNAPFALFGLCFAILGLYLATGLFGSKKTGTYNALSLMSGLAPPAHYNFFRPEGKLNDEKEARYASLSKCANNFDCFHDYYEGLAYAKEKNKPILLDFTGYGCVNCRKTEEHIWVKDNIRDKINDDFVLVSLYVDDKMALDTPYLVSPLQDNKKMKKVGDLWADFQIANFKQNSQPLYVLISPDEKVLTAPRGYNPDVEGYEAFLNCGLNAFKEMNPDVLGSAK
ncbi:MAG TPA: cytochrome c biogenesis protein CcdA [Saprospiraceae bacterium]|nr:cytochrome c biogenesis protein CcdA [Saprospiraceae bacterium]